MKAAAAVPAKKTAAKAPSKKAAAAPKLGPIARDILRKAEIVRKGLKGEKL